jgi:hypothetical protein
MCGYRSSILAIEALTLMVCSQFSIGAPLQTHSDYEAARSQITVTLDQQRAACNALSEAPKNLCIVEAQAAANRGRAEATVNYQGTNRSRINSQMVNIRADFMVARARCATQSVTMQSECINLAQVTRDRLLDEVRAARRASALASKANTDTPGSAQETVDLSQCDALVGSERDACTASVLSSLGQ